MLKLFDTHYETTYWEYFTARAGQHVVQFTGTYAEQQFVFQFVVEEDYSSFSIGALKQNNILLRPEDKWTYVKSLTMKKTSNAEEIVSAFDVFLLFSCLKRQIYR